MTDFRESKIETPTGDVDGANRDFVTSVPYQAGQIRVVVNGLVGVAGDAVYGWTEVDDTTIQMASPPLVGDVVEVFYQEKQAEQIVGSPFHPSGALP